MPIRSNLPEDEEQTYAALLSQLATKSTSLLYVYFFLLSCAPSFTLSPRLCYTFIDASRPNTAPSAANSVVRTLDEGDELTFFRIRSKKHEIMVAPDKEYLLVVIQDPNL